MEPKEKKKLTYQDFVPENEVKWCPGCGDYSILAQVQRVLPELGLEREKFVCVSGIGCSSRFPYYMNTYGFHGIHGRAAAIATGLKVSRPDLSIWVATGDGDMMSIGGNHFIHACRKNVDLNILLFNNRIYGLTKGQYSPTSQKGMITKTSPYGVVDHPFKPIALAIGSGATFVARSIDREPKHMQEMIKKAGEHKGLSFVEIYQNCVIFNDGEYSKLTDKDSRDDNLLVLEDKKPMIFGKGKDKGIKLVNFKPVVIDLNKKENSIEDVLIHDETDESSMRAIMLACMIEDHKLPTPIGIFRRVQKSTYDGDVNLQLHEVTKKYGKGDLNTLLNGGNTWEIK
ncbi:MAG: 2-oxoacid:ferredoxin oxidoreductase subunit beta [Ignavibacteriales bacterium]|nr:2-oxoacid:ferredoxin oxidoreductase subunit beta [Ignavibacteriales bacterium]